MPRAASQSRRLNSRGLSCIEATLESLFATENAGCRVAFVFGEAEAKLRSGRGLSSGFPRLAVEDDGGLSAEQAAGSFNLRD